MQAQIYIFLLCMLTFSGTTRAQMGSLSRICVEGNKIYHGRCEADDLPRTLSDRNFTPSRQVVIGRAPCKSPIDWITQEYDVFLPNRSVVTD